MPNPILIAKNAQTELALLPALANRHGCITGATGTGKTVTLQVLAESFSRIGTPVFMADVKGDLTGVSQAGAASPKLQERLKSLGLAEPAWAASPVALWDVFGEQGAPVRATISDMGPLLLARILELNDTQEGVLALVFKVADDEGQLLLDLKDLRAMLQNVADRSAELKTRYGNVSAASVGAIQRSLLTLESQGAEKFFGEPMLDVADLMRTDAQGRGIVNVLAADKLMQAPRLYAIFLLWLLGDLYEKLPEVGDMEQPKLVFFFDEAHLLFTDAPQALLTKIEQVVRMVRSRASGCISSPRTRWIFPTRCWGSWATASSTRCAPSRRATRRPSRRRRRPCVPIPGWISRPPSPNWASARPWCPCWTPRGGRSPPSAPGSCRRPVASGRPRMPSARRCDGPIPCRPSTSRRSTANPPMRCWRAGHRPPLARMAAARRARRASGRADAGWRGGRLHAGPERSAVRIDRPQGWQARRGGPDDGQEHRPHGRPGTGARHPGIVAWLEGAPLTLREDWRSRPT